MSQSVILCEGYHDRAFWAGWLPHLGCTDPGKPPPGSTRRIDVIDPAGKRVSRGEFGFRSRSDRFIRIVPCHGKTNIRPAALLRLHRREVSPPLERLVFNVDADVPVDGAETATGIRQQDVLALARECDQQAKIDANGDIELDGGTTRVSLVRWGADDEAGDGLPNKQTLERLVCAAIVAAYPDRAGAVQTWLKARPSPPKANVKEYAWSYMAGWYAEHGCQSFYSNLWTDAAIAAELQSRLEAAGAWRVGEALAE